MLPNLADLTDYVKLLTNDIKIPCEIALNYFYINRNLEQEKKLFDLTVGKLHGEPYIFIYYDRNKINSNAISVPNNICVYHPSINFYENDPGHKYYEIWNGKQENILDYCQIIENSSEIYVINDSFFHLAKNLNLNANTKTVYGLSDTDILENMPESEKNGWNVLSLSRYN